MVLKNIYLKNCVVFGVRCDVLCKKRSMEIKNAEILIKVENAKIVDKMCRKHENKILWNEKIYYVNAYLQFSRNPILTSTPPESHYYSMFLLLYLLYWFY